MSLGPKSCWIKLEKNKIFLILARMAAEFYKKKNKIHVIWPERLLNYIRKEQDVFNLGPKGCRI